MLPMGFLGTLGAGTLGTGDIGNWTLIPIPKAARGEDFHGSQAWQGSFPSQKEGTDIAAHSPLWGGLGKAGRAAGCSGYPRPKGHTCPLCPSASFLPLWDRPWCDTPVATQCHPPGCPGITPGHPRVPGSSAGSQLESNPQHLDQNPIFQPWPGCGSSQGSVGILIHRDPDPKPAPPAAPTPGFSILREAAKRNQTLPELEQQQLNPND